MECEHDVIDLYRIDSARVELLVLLLEAEGEKEYVTQDDKTSCLPELWESRTVQH